MAGDSSAKQRWKWLRVGGRNSAKSKTHDGSAQHANAVLSPEPATPSTTAAPPALRPTADAATPLPLAAPPAPPDVVFYTSLDNTGGGNPELLRAAADDRAVSTGEHSARSGSHQDRANNTLRTLEPGLYVIFDSIRDDEPPNVAEVDVVAIHGLNFEGVPNHAQKTWTKGDKLWLKDFVPDYLPKPARVMLFAYNSSPAFGASAIRLDDHARNLLQWLSLERGDVPQRPIVFICHSLGGLVVKQALVEAKLDESYKSIFEATCLLVFFATPHRGGNYASVGHVAAKLFTKALRTGPNDLTNALERNSNEATKRFEQARHIFERTLVVNFYEGRRYHKTDVIVDKDSGTLNLPGSIEKQVAVDADHSSICKFDSNDSPVCQLVLKSIAAEVKRGLELARENRGPDPLSFSERDNKCLEDLQVTDPREDKVRIELDKGGLLRESYHWVLSHVDFLRWRNDRHAHLLWIKGDPGKGKTMLLCGIIDELKATALTANISFFFCQATHARINTATAVLRGLIYMLVTQQPALISHLRKSYDGFGKERFEGPNSWVALSKILSNILEDPRLGRAYLIIDALDECTGNQGLLLDLVAQKSSKYPSIKWLVSSRNWPSIEKDLDTATQKVGLRLELNEESVSAAVTTYVQFKVDWLATRNKYGNETRATIERYLSANAHNTFLWVALVCQELANISDWEAEEVLTTFPPRLDALYRRMMGQIYNSRRAKLLQRILAVISVVYRPITLDELPALVDTLDSVSGNYEALAEIVGLCGSFLTLRERTISFVHQSAKDFLLKQAHNELFPSGIEDIHRFIFSRSLGVVRETLRRDIYNLGAPGFSINKVRPPDPDPLAAARYSCIYWINHLRDCDPKKNANKDLQDGGSIDTFLREKYLYWLEALSLLRGIPEGTASMLELEKLFEAGKETSLLAERVRDACRFIVYHKWAIENSPLQVYASALVFSPASSMTRSQFKNEEPKWIIQKPTMADNWSACLQTLEGHSESVSSVAWSHNATWLASASEDKTVKIWDPATGQCVSTLEGHSGYVRSVAWSHDATRLRLASASHDKTVKIWDPATGQCISTLEGHCGFVLSVAWSYDVTQLASASWDKTVKIWDPETGQCVWTLEGHRDLVLSVAWSHDATRLRLASASYDKTIKIWDPATGQCISTLEGHSSYVGSISWSNDATRLALAAHDDTVKIWYPETGKCLSTLEGHSGSVQSVAWSYNATQLASASFDKTVKIWDPATGQCISTLEGHSSYIFSIAWSQDATRLASASEDKTVKIWDPTAGQYMSTLEGHSKLVHSVAWSHDATWLASASEDKTVKIWDPATGQYISTLEGHNGYVHLVAWSYDTTQLALALDNGIVKIWDPVTSQCVSTLEGHTDCISSIAWSYNATQLASASHDDTVKIWDPATGQCLSTFKGHSSEVNSVAWSHNMTHLASASLDQTVKIWDSVTGQCVLTLKGHSDEVTSVAWLHDATRLRLASTSYDNTVKIWDLAIGQCMLTLKGHTDCVYSVAWSHDATRLASASHDDTVKIWDPATGQCVLTLEIDRKLRDFQFHESNSDLLYSDLGVFNLRTVAISPVFIPASIDHSSPIAVGYGLSNKGTWITYQGENLLWLPPEYRPSSSAISGTVVSIGCSSGRVLIFAFSDSNPIS
ncbi:WD40-repeat-containing domain protein [Dichotomopilus funicola]|uniref:WD40-repeat-containing domain protein n=1 Tax=Dichotomopilus funicola TaxID=1934379 RepID=A0AAN6UYU8_9PEZI|nr:WD40-repeat-containing domain protein [Dichotomopilus funicola]